MALSERARSALFQAFAELTDEEAVGEMLSHFPTRDAEEPVTKEHLDRRFAEVDARFAEIDTKIEALRTEVQRQANRLLVSMIAVAGVAVAVVRLGV